MKTSSICLKLLNIFNNKVKIQAGDNKIIELLGMEKAAEKTTASKVNTSHFQHHNPHTFDLVRL